MRQLIALLFDLCYRELLDALLECFGITARLDGERAKNGPDGVLSLVGKDDCADGETCFVEVWHIALRAGLIEPPLQFKFERPTILDRRGRPVVQIDRLVVLPDIFTADEGVARRFGQ